jgi:hypothetical protein
MKDHPRLQFRWAPHVSGITQIKPRDYEDGGVVEAQNFYDAWAILRGSPKALDIGDALESASGDLRICKYVGFEEARWMLPEVKPEHQEPETRGGAAASTAA